MTRFVLALLVVLAAAIPAGGQDDFAEQLKAYRAELKRPSLYKRTKGREAFAATQDARALDTLAKDYKRPEDPKDQVQYLIASITCDQFRGAQHLDALDAWRAANTRDRDAWLWYRVLRNHVALNGPAHAIALAGDTKHDLFLRAACMEAVANHHDESVLQLAAATLADIGTDRRRWVLVDSCAAILAGHVARKATPPFKELGQALAKLLDDKTVPERTRYNIARSLKHVYGTGRAWMNAEPWQRLLNGEQPDKGELHERPSFLGIEAEGRNICYLIDMSDSMLVPLTPREKEDLKITGAGEGKPADAKPDHNIDDALPWDKINTRFDAAREFLKLSLKQLAADQSFCVLWFGTNAGMLDACTGMQKATPKHIEKVIAELDTIKIHPPREGRPDGELRGMTNMHGAFHRAFKVRGKGLAKEYEYVDWSTFEQGCDTIFLLSDGKQNWADWAANDSSDGQEAGDPEAGKIVGKADVLYYYGPYVHGHHMLDDIRRLNMFRKVEIHCVGIGEAEEGTLRAIAAIGRGKLRFVGRED